jgi:hypothetical protein
MLLESILEPIFWLVKMALSIVPSFEIADSVAGSMSLVFTSISSIGYFFPVGTLATILGLTLSFYVIKFTISAINWLVAKIPAIN